MKRLSLVFMLAGILLAILLVFAFGAHHVLSALLSVGWRGFALMVAGQLAVTLLLALSWFSILPNARPSLYPVLYWGRLVREGGGRFLPFLPVGGFVMGARAVSLAGLPMPLAAASTLVDVAAEFTAEVLFAALGPRRAGGMAAAFEPHPADRRGHRDRRAGGGHLHRPARTRHPAGAEASGTHRLRGRARRWVRSTAWPASSTPSMGASWR